jgi:hypothetical protein
MLNSGHRYYDRLKYGKLVLDVAETVLKAFEVHSIDATTPLKQKKLEMW